METKKATFSFSAAVLAVTLAAAFSPARAAVVITLPKAGTYTAWVTGSKQQVLAGPAAVEGAKAVLDTGTAKNKGDWTVTVEDTKSGNAAVAKAPAGDSPRVTLKADDFSHIGLVSVQVTDKAGKAPSFAAVTLTDGKGSAQTVALRPADAGKAVFHDVASGNGSVRVQQGDPDNQQTVTVRLPLERSEPALTLTADVALPDGMKTQGAAAKEGSEPAPTGANAPAPVASRGGLGQIIGFLVTLAFLGLIAVFALRFLRNKGVTAQSALAAAGIQLPEDQEPVPTTVAAEAPQMVDPTVCPFCGAKKDAAGTCPNCAVTGGAPPPSAGYAPATSGGGKRLVALSGPRAGSIFPVSGPLTIGRESGRDIAIPEDPSLSRHHAQVQPENGALVIVDEGSSNGTLVNGQRVSRQPLRSGDEIILGASRFRYEE